jgi:hypothetical protein
MLHIVDGMDDDEWNEDFRAVVKKRGETAPSEAGPISPKVRRERFEAIQHFRNEMVASYFGFGDAF